MELKCPACNKINTEYICTRCNCNLEVLFELVSLSDNIIKTGIKYLVEKNTCKANEFALQSWSIKKTKDAAFLGLSASVLNNDNKIAADWYRRLCFITNENRK